jgi:hypothetical protein
MTPVIDQLAEALRGTANYTYEDKVNCWCAAEKCFDSKACVDARKALASYAAKKQREHRESMGYARDRGDDQS